MSEQEEYVTELMNNRIKNTGRTAVLRFLNVAVAAIGPFFVRTAMIYSLGDTYAGLSDLFFSLISILNMAELGLSNVITFFLYEPLAKGDREGTEHYLNVLRRVYRLIGVVIAVVGIVMLPFVPYLTKDGIPEDANVYLSFALLLGATSIQYFIIPEIIVLANASQKGYLISISNIVGCVLLYILQAIAVIVLHSFLLYYVAVVIQAIIILLLNGYIKRRYFYGYVPQGDISSLETKELRKKVLCLIGHQMDEKFISSIDKIIISMVLGLSLVTRYGNYMFVVTAFAMLFSSIFTSMTASLGNAYITESRESNYVRFRAILWLNGIMTAWAAGVMFCSYQTFMELWMKDLLLPIESVVLFCVYFFVMQIRSSVMTFKNAIGMWYEDRYKPYVSMLVNLGLDIVMVNLIGINGALLSSIICVLLIEIPWEAKVLYMGYFSQNLRGYFVHILEYAGFAVAVTIGAYMLSSLLFKGIGFFVLLEKSVLTTVLFVIATFLCFFRSEELSIWKKSILFLVRKKRNDD